MSVARKFILLLLFAIGSIMLSLPAAAQVSKVGTTSAAFLEIPVGARSTAMGGAVAADVSDLSAMHWNPAGLASIHESKLMVEYADWFVDMRHNYLGFSLPVSDYGTFGLNITALTMGEFQETTFDFPEGTGRTFSAYSLAVGISYAHQILRNFQVGANVKLITEKIMNTSAQTLAIDIGTIYKTPFDGLRFGVGISNVGGKMQMGGEDLIVTTDLDDDGLGNYKADATLRTAQFHLPLRLQVGLAYDIINTDQLRATITADGHSPNNNTQSVSLGSEVSFFHKKISIRAGLPHLGKEDRIQKFTAGIGFEHRFSPYLKANFGYVYQSFQYLNYVNRISFTMEF